MSCDITYPQIQRPYTSHVWQKSEIEEAFENISVFSYTIQNAIASIENSYRQYILIKQEKVYNGGIERVKNTDNKSPAVVTCAR